MRRGGVPFDQLQKTNLYTGKQNPEGSLERDNAALAGGKKKKKKHANRPKINIDRFNSVGSSEQVDQV